MVWRKSIGTGYSAVSVRDGLAVTAYSDSTSNYLVAFDADTGDPKWRHTIGPVYLGHYGSQSGPIATPLITADRVIALGPRGTLFALGLTTGEPIWRVDLVSEHGAIAPFWGFTSSPKRHNDRVIVQMGGTRGNAVAAFDLASGQQTWSALSDSVNYQSPILDRLDDSQHLLFLGDTVLAGLDPVTGKVLWSIDHDGRGGAGATSGHPIRTGHGRYFIKSGSGGAMVEIRATEEGAYLAEEAWRSKHLSGTYIYPVYHDGLIFGYNRRILTAIDAATGERIWRSREPGDGLPFILNGHLLIITKEGRLSISPANDEGYTEVAVSTAFRRHRVDAPQLRERKTLRAQYVGDRVRRDHPAIDRKG